MEKADCPPKTDDDELVPNAEVVVVVVGAAATVVELVDCLLYTSPSPRDGLLSRMPSSA